MLALVVALLAPRTVVAPITFQSLLADLHDVQRLTSPADYTYFQASSYDRDSVKPGDPTWFANGDFGQYIRDENRNGVVEHVMADLKGPGAVMRVWSANPTGTVRFYFDGADRPLLEMPLKDLFLGGVVPESSGLGYTVARGYDLYAPIPYAKSLKITVSGDGTDRLYYHVGYRTYPKGTQVETFDPLTAKSIKLADYNIPPIASPLAHELSQSGSVTLNGTGVLTDFSVDISKRSGTWRDVPFQIIVDGEDCVNATVGDFFGCPQSARPMASQVMDVKVLSTSGATQEHVVFTFRLPIPYLRRLNLFVGNDETFNIAIKGHFHGLNTAPPYRLYSQTNEHLGPTRPLRDMQVAKINGSGRYVGTILTVENPDSGWWGEGDEKVTIDGASFPQIFGTGTEDFFGYAWSNPEIHGTPFHGQPRADSPQNFGHISNYRWQTFDDIPFTKSLDFQLEMWHWTAIDARYTTTAFWYGEPGKTKITHPDLPPVRELVAGAPVPGALEGEELQILSKTGGTTEKQGSWAQLSKFEQLWWKDAAQNDVLVLQVPVEKAGRYRLEANCAFANDYGIQNIVFNGQVAATIDFYHPTLEWKVVDLGIFDLNAGVTELRITCKSHNDKAEPRNMFGLDYILLKPVADPKP